MFLVSEGSQDIMSNDHSVHDKTGPATPAARTIIAADSKVLLFSAEQFTTDICDGDACFVCGAASGSKKFNNEHVIPRWVLKRYNLFAKQITLPNGVLQRYGTYVMPCCADCNTLLGDRIETPMSKLLEGGFDSIVSRLNAETVSSLYIWLCLLFVKTHMKDRAYRVHKDFRDGDARIADEYFWPEMHHLHCVSRIPYVEAVMSPDIIGTMRWFRIDDPVVADVFDWLDLSNEQTISLRLGDFGLICVLTDAGATASALRDRLDTVSDATLTVIQLRELAARLGVANSDLINRPAFGTLVLKTRPERVHLWTKHDEIPVFKPLNMEKLGSAMDYVLHGHLAGIAIDGEREPEKVRAILRTGKASFLFDDKGGFMRRIELADSNNAQVSKSSGARHS